MSSNNSKELRVSIAVIGDWDGVSNSAYGYSMNPDIPSMGNDFGLVAVQMLDSPLATDNVDLDQDGITDIYIGEKLKMTDWHWFSWYNRPGVVFLKVIVAAMLVALGLTKLEIRKKYSIK